jgi:hypothetical protein
MHHMVEFGGHGQDILLLHGLMGRATTCPAPATSCTPPTRSPTAPPSAHSSAACPEHRVAAGGQPISMPVTRARTGLTGCSAVNASAGRSTASTQCGSQVPGR